MSKNLYLQFDDEIITNAEDILDDIGIDCQTFFKMCLKKLVKEDGISFLTTNMNFKTNSEQAEKKLILFENMEENKIMNNSAEKSKITSVMRDCIWDIFKFQYNTNKKLNYPYSEKLAAEQSKISKGSAHIYFLFLNNLLNGVSNTRVIKYSDLEVYLRNINDQFGKVYIENAIKSLSDSIPYWEEHTTLYSYAKKVSRLILQYK